MPNGGAMLLADNVKLAKRVRDLRMALVVIQKGLTDDADGEFWSARKWLDKRDIYHGDLSGLRILDLVAKTALGKP
jgi:hypothetical protein